MPTRRTILVDPPEGARVLIVSSGANRDWCEALKKRLTAAKGRVSVWSREDVAGHAEREPIDIVALCLASGEPVTSLDAVLRRLCEFGYPELVVIAEGKSPEYLSLAGAGLRHLVPVGQAERWLVSALPSLRLWAESRRKAAEAAALEPPAPARVYESVFTSGERLSTVEARCRESYLRTVLAHTEGNRRRAAHLAGLEYRTFNLHLQKLGITQPNSRDNSRAPRRD